jgi:CheY-like chemotaxis protein
MSAAATVLLVEDNPDDVFFLERVFVKRGLGSALRVLPDGAQAIDYLGAKGEFADRVRHPLPAFVLLDLQLPFYTGLQILSWAREQPELRSVPIIILSSSTQQSDKEQALQLGARAYHVKPADPDELHGIVATLQDEFLPQPAIPA